MYVLINKKNVVCAISETLSRQENGNYLISEHEAVALAVVAQVIEGDYDETVVGSIYENGEFTIPAEVALAEIVEVLGGVNE